MKDPQLLPGFDHSRIRWGLLYHFHRGSHLHLSLWDQGLALWDSVASCQDRECATSPFENCRQQLSILLRFSLTLRSNGLSGWENVS